MISGILAGILWAIETLILGMALKMVPFVSSAQAIILAPFVSTFIHDLFAGIIASIINGVKKESKELVVALKSKSGKYLIMASIIGGPIGMSGYVLSVSNMGPSIGAVASAIYPAIGAVLAYIFLKEKISWYRWIFLIISLLGVYGLSYSPDININNFWLGFLGTLMCSFGWGIEAVIITKYIKNVKNEVALQIRLCTSAIIYGLIIIPLLKAWPFTISIISNNPQLILIIGFAGLFACLSYFFFYNALRQIGAAKAMALDVTYCAWDVIFSIVFLHERSLLNPLSISCVIIVLVFGILAACDYKELFKKRNKLNN